MVDEIRFEVRGMPVPQGSSRAFVVRGRPIITSANRNLGTWRRLVSDIAQQHAPPDLWLEPLVVDLDFRLPRPISEPTHAGRGKNRHPITTYPLRKPDLDKMVRSVLDSLTKIIFRDDAQVVCLRATKSWGPPGVTVSVKRVL